MPTFRWIKTQRLCHGIASAGGACFACLREARLLVRIIKKQSPFSAVKTFLCRPLRQDDCFLLEVDLPGVKPEDVIVKVEDGDLVLRGSRELERTHENSHFYIMERSSGRFMRCLKLPESVQATAIRAEFCEGVLAVIIPKVKQPRGEAT
jgi:HSP20 family molecular chaperone IbpA